MTTKILRSPDDIPKLAAFLSMRTKYPLQVTITQGESRREAQNRLSQRWYSDIARQLGDRKHEDVRADCKVTFGVPIMRRESEDFRTSWDATIGALPYDMQREAVKNLDVPVTRLMLVKPMAEYMNAVLEYWTPHGVRLTDPEALKYEQEFA